MENKIINDILKDIIIVKNCKHRLLIKCTPDNEPMRRRAFCNFGLTSRCTENRDSLNNCNKYIPR